MTCGAGGRFVASQPPYDRPELLVVDFLRMWNAQWIVVLSGDGSGRFKVLQV
jgi:hypothetical protein